MWSATDERTNESTHDGLSEDVIFDIVSNRRRRFVLRHLHNEQNPAQLTDIATELAAAESDTTPEQVDKQARKRAYVSLYQTHIPRLAEAEIVEYDEETGEVFLTDSAEEVLHYIRRGQSGDVWPRVYLALALVGLGIYLPPLVGATSDELLVAGLLVPLGLLAVSLLHWRWTRAR
jgi:DNA-binding transcriptional ArsR family regulator